MEPVEVSEGKGDSFPGDHPRWVYGVLCVAIALAFLVIGWWPFSPSPRNRVSWLSSRPGLSFEPSGVAYSTGAVLGAQRELPETFAVELFIAPRGGPRAASQYILSLHDGELPSAFAVCQWKAELLLRIPDPANVRGFREVAVGGLEGPARLYTIVCHRTGTEIYVDGRLSRRFPQFRVPAGVWRGRLVLGDAAAGKQAWTGDVLGLALIERDMKPDLIGRRFEAWRTQQVGELQRDSGVVALFLFDEQSGSRVANAGSLRTYLEIPERYGVVQKQAFSFPLNRWEFWRSGRRDAVVNLLGFVPFGGLCFLWVRNRGAGGSGRAWLWAALAGLGLSAVIETGQIWLPTRVSSATDLILNTLGSMGGAGLVAGVSRALPRVQERRAIGRM